VHGAVLAVRKANSVLGGGNGLARSLLALKAFREIEVSECIFGV